ncbi:Ger(x)C family spore germination protein [Paenibacillus sp. GYB004]|uniref:Ger(x)C family spore germination protein n=1 Tax=Paenibacillus sp. GYB004 TaxID=2994393 RepID=UPI002F96168C
MKPATVIAVLLTVVLLSVTTGCWNRKELNDLAITAGLGIDLTDNGEYRVSAQVVKPGEITKSKGSSLSSPVLLYSETGSTVFEAIRKMTISSPRKIYLAHLRILVIGEKLARKGIGEALDLVSRDQELRTDFFIVVAKGGKAEDVLKALTPLDTIPSVKMFNSLEISEKVWAPTAKVTLDKLVTAFASTGRQPVLSAIQLTGDKEIGNQTANLERIEQAAYLKYTGLAALKEDKLVGWLNENESKGLNYMLGNVKSTVGFVNCPGGGKTAMEVIRTVSSMKARIVDGKPVADVVVRMETNVGEVMCKIDLTKEESILDLERRSNQMVKSFIAAALQQAQKQLKVDIFGFGEAVHRADPKVWRQLEPDWDRHFSNMQIHVKVISKVRRVGTTNNSFLNKLKEDPG